MSVETMTQPHHRGLGTAWAVLGQAASLQPQGQTSAPWTAGEGRLLTQQSHASSEHPTRATPHRTNTTSSQVGFKRHLVTQSYVKKPKPTFQILCGYLGRGRGGVLTG